MNRFVNIRLFDKYNFSDGPKYFVSGFKGASWDGIDWSFQDTVWAMKLDPGEHRIVAHAPLPAATVLGVLGLGVAGWRLRRRV